MKVNVEKKKIKVWNFYGSTNVGFMKQLFITESRKKNKLAYLLHSWAWRLPTCPRCCTRCGRTPGMCNQRNPWASDFLASALWSRPEKENTNSDDNMTTTLQESFYAFSPYWGRKRLIGWGEAKTRLHWHKLLYKRNIFSLIIWNIITMKFHEMKVMWSFSELSTSSWRALWTLENFQYRWWVFRSRGSLIETKSASDGDGLTVSEAAVGRIRRLANWTQGAPLCGRLMLW